MSIDVDRAKQLMKAIDAAIKKDRWAIVVMSVVEEGEDEKLNVVVCKDQFPQEAAGTACTEIFRTLQQEGSLLLPSMMR